MNIVPRFFPDVPIGASEIFHSESEKRVYDALKKTLLDEGIFVLYSVKWLYKKYPDSRPEEREADFVLIHPIHGLLVVEIKGGTLIKDRDNFFREYPNGRRELADDPVMQARNNFHSLKNELEKFESVPKPLRGGYALIFPDMFTKVTGGLGPLAAKEAVCFAEHLPHLGEKLIEIMKFWVRERPQNVLGATAAETIFNCLLPYTLPDSKLSHELKENEKRIVRLTEKQKKILDLLVNIPQALIAGGAGTGKTYLAAEKAQRLAKSGAEVLLSCFNRQLAVELGRRYKFQGLTIVNFHQLCWQRACAAKLVWNGLSQLPDPDGEQAHSLPNDYFSEFLPRALQDTNRIGEGWFDALIIDEGQDFDSAWIAALRGSLRDPKQGIFYMFYDDNQNLWLKENWLPQDMPIFPLKENLRNSRKIFETFHRLYDGLEMNSAGPDGGLVDFIQVDASSLDNIVTELSALLNQLLERDKIAAKDVAVLSGVSLKHSALKYLRDFPDEISRSSVMRFKGLEKPVVILIEMDPWFDRGLQPMYGSMFSRFQNPENLAHSLLYVGMSRARTHLFILGSKKLLRDMKRGKLVARYK